MPIPIQIINTIGSAKLQTKQTLMLLVVFTTNEMIKAQRDTNINTYKKLLYYSSQYVNADLRLVCYCFLFNTQVVMRQRLLNKHSATNTVDGLSMASFKSSFRKKTIRNSLRSFLNDAFDGHVRSGADFLALLFHCFGVAEAKCRRYLYIYIYIDNESLRFVCEVCCEFHAQETSDMKI